MIAYAEGTVAAALKELKACTDELKKALTSTEVTAWKHVGLAHSHAITATAQVEHALELDRLAEEKDA